METTLPNGQRELTITNAVVSIRAVRVDGKPMTISVLNQIPQIEDHYQSTPWGDRAIGRINRCPNGCRGGDDVHVLATTSDGELVLYRGVTEARPFPPKSAYPITIHTAEELLSRPFYCQRNNDGSIYRIFPQNDGQPTSDKDLQAVQVFIADYRHVEAYRNAAMAIPQIYVAA